MGSAAVIIAVLCFAVALALCALALRPNRSKERSQNLDRPNFGRRMQPTPHSDAVSAREAAGAIATIPDMSDVGMQLKAIMSATFQKRKVMNMSEYKMFVVVESEIAAAKKGHRAFAQTSMGQILESPSSEAFRSINAKRVDVLVVDRGGWPVFAVEYQGPGHYQGTAAARDAIKKEALRRAGVGYLEVTSDDSEHQLRTHIREYLGIAKAPDPVVPPKKSKSRTIGGSVSALH